MDIYLVRHGQTSGNVAKRHQAEHTGLTKFGREQVVVAAEKIKELKPTHLLTSNLVRAIETATIISNACGLTPETNHNFIELRRPKHIYGRYHYSLLSLWYYSLWYLGRDTVAMDGGESYLSLRKRIKAAQEQISTYPSDAKLVIVSHSVFINMFIAHLCSGKPLTPFRAFIIFTGMLKMPNTHIIHLSFSSSTESNNCAWSVVGND
ncbi:histidine phosphatase family protein [Candidatus Nomurabacteria bacterium]|nr:histidine phosphatase family protein [Candidatus Kaiserbacteria bacterium]MCB9815267.1 histidine phosphatase family protein [Candidatus Nomurabacteria bacterium]